jgi:hypothetical protein
MAASIASLLVFLLSVWQIEALPGVALRGMGGGEGVTDALRSPLTSSVLEGLPSWKKRYAHSFYLALLNLCM